MYEQIQAKWLVVQGASQKVQDSISNQNFSQQFVQQLIEFAVAINDLKQCIVSLPNVQESHMWQQRQSEVHQQLLGLTAQGLQGNDPSQFWEHIGQLLYYTAIEIKQSCQQTQSQYPGSSPLRALGDGQKDEVYALKAKVIVAEQECQKRVQENSQMSLRIKELEAQSDKLQEQIKELEKEKEFYQSRFDSQSEVIEQLMTRNESNEKQRAEAQEEATTLRNHNKALSVSLEKHAGTIEGLVRLNEELSEALHKQKALAQNIGARDVSANSQIPQPPKLTASEQQENNVGNTNADQSQTN
eukprot:TRINITY_DN7131_c0_g1_i1.p1 TRINITY_DN7131_c0_g1~~TRINITY_DN7131_c0_g1_i1.p1  ORF type:complete len:318 (+),score=29.08 TRINITY_DN7131_c0_g1_i1:57-956(+)